MESINTFKTRSEIEIQGKKYVYFNKTLVGAYIAFHSYIKPDILMENPHHDKDVIKHNIGRILFPPFKI